MTTAARATTVARKATAAAQETDREIMLRKLRTRSTEELVALGVRALKDEEMAKAEYGMVCDVLGERFPRKKQEEELVTEYGAAKRKLTKAYSIHDDADIRTIRKALGLRFTEFIEEKPEYNVPTDRIDALRTRLGDDSKKFIISTVSYGLTKKAIAHLKSEPESALLAYVTIDEKEKISIVRAIKQ
ncbi:MAG: hypothetical protein ABI876_09270 [Bacteroidota bacterium]